MEPTRDENARGRAASSPTMPPAWVFSPISNGHVYEDAASGRVPPYAILLDSPEIARPKSVPPADELAHAPPAPPPLPAPTSIKERRKFSRKYGSGVYSESPQQNKAYGSLSDTRRASSTIVSLRQSDPYITPSLSPTFQSPYASKENGTTLYCCYRAVLFESLIISLCPSISALTVDISVNISSRYANIEFLLQLDTVWPQI